jgi:DNA polymerase-1
MFGRVRSIPGINAKNGMIRSSAERMAINMPVQCTSADIIKIAMIEVDRKLTAMKLETRMLLQVHDELVFEAPENELEAVCPMIKKCMENAVKLDVPLEVQLDKGNNWSQMKGWGEL